MAKILIFSFYRIQHIQYVWVIHNHFLFTLFSSFCNVLNFMAITQISYILTFFSFLILFCFFFVTSGIKEAGVEPDKQIWERNSSGLTFEKMSFTEG